MIMEITKDKSTEIFCAIDDFCKEYDAEIEKMAISEPNGGKHRRRKWSMNRSEIMAILRCHCHFLFRYFISLAHMILQEYVGKGVFQRFQCRFPNLWL